MKTNIFVKSFFFLIISFSWGCENFEEVVSMSTLTETTWKLVGSVDGTTGTINALQGKSFCSYQLQFNSDKTLFGKLSTDDITGIYVADFNNSTMQIQNLTDATRTETEDTFAIIERLKKVHSFSLAVQRLNLFFDEQKNYLLFEPIFSYGIIPCFYELFKLDTSKQGVISKQDLLGDWQLDAYFDFVNCVAKWEPNESWYPIHIEFKSHGSISGNTIGNVYTGFYEIKNSKIYFSNVILTELNDPNPQRSNRFIDTLFHNSDYAYFSVVDSILIIYFDNSDWGMIFSKR
jgi:hypothetical protein